MSRKFHKKNKKLLILVSIAIVLFVLVLKNISHNNSPTPVPITSIQPDESQTEQRNRLEDEILGVINRSLADQNGKYAVYLKDLKTGQLFEYNADETYGSASIYKLAVMYKTYDEIAKGNLGKDINLIGDKAALERRIFGEDERENNAIENFQPETEDPAQNVAFDVETALYEMITVSDNYSALLLADRLGWKNIDTLLKENGIYNFNLDGKNSPNITARDTGLLLEKIYDGSAVNPKYSQEMLNLLLAQKVNDRIPRYLPENIKVAHKTGELETVRHDAGIVFGQKSDYIFVFLSDTPDQDESVEVIAQLSQKLYEALENSRSLN